MLVLMMQRDYTAGISTEYHPSNHLSKPDYYPQVSIIRINKDSEASKAPTAV
jgi:hypothetical protein